VPPFFIDPSMPKRLLFLCLAFLLMSGSNSWAQEQVPWGVWADEQGKTQIELYRCGERLCGKIVALNSPNDADGRPLLDTHNPDPKRRNQPHLGLTVLQKLSYNASTDRWEDGEIYDPNNGRTYSCYVHQLGPDRLEVKGYIGFAFIGRAQIWTRVRERSGASIKE
jgi:uncharacterized protein (DUF2147 family)